MQHNQNSFFGFAESGCNQGNVFPGYQAHFVEDAAQHEIGACPDAAAAHDFASQILEGFDRRASHQLKQRSSVGRYDGDWRALRDCGNHLRSGGGDQMDIARQESAEDDVARSDGDKFYVQSVLFEETRVACNPKGSPIGSDGGVGNDERFKFSFLADCELRA